MPGVDMYPENPQGTLLKVLTEGTFYSATTSLSDLSPVDLIFDQIGMHYGVQILVSKSQAYSTDEEIFAAVVDGEIDGTDSTMSVVSPTHDTSEVLDLREGCSVYGSQPLLASLVTTGINNTYQLNEVINYRLSVGQTSQVCCETDFEKTLFELLFPNAEIIVMNTPALCAQYMKSQPDVVLASKATQNQVDLDNALTAYRAATIFPITSFFRKEILEQNKVSIDQEVQWFDQGNTALVTLVDNALMSLVFSEDQEYQDIFHSYNYTDIFFTAVFPLSVCLC
ncbi:hypothetical protein Pelo_17456 [Pelomyxa schiedti]|nr:hypothetical protein Pelo_17456 [Pelomyxa schiedti]